MKGVDMVLRLNLKAFEELQGDMTDIEFANHLGISRSQLFRVRNGKSFVGENFIEKFMICYPDKSVNEYFFPDYVALTAQDALTVQ